MPNDRENVEIGHDGSIQCLKKRFLRVRNNFYMHLMQLYKQSKNHNEIQIKIIYKRYLKTIIYLYSKVTIIILR